YNPLLQPIEMDIFFYKLIEKGVYSWERRICFLSVAHTDKDIDFIIQQVKVVIREMIEGDFFPEATIPVGIEPVEIQQESRETRVPSTDAQKQLWLLAQVDEG